MASRKIMSSDICLTSFAEALGSEGQFTQKKVSIF